MLKGKLALITGASRGIGAAIAKRFAAEGAHVILVARTVGGLEEVDDAIRTAGGEATLVPLDLTDGDLIDQLGATLYERWGKLDILVGNAGMLHRLGPLAHIDPKEWNDGIAINLNANYRLIRAMEPLLLQSNAPRAMFVTSGITRHHAAYWAGYAATKAALEAMILSYAAEKNETAFRINLVDPGIVATAMRAQAFPGEDASTLAPTDSITDSFIRLADDKCEKHGQIIQASSR